LANTVRHGGRAQSRRDRRVAARPPAFLLPAAQPWIALIHIKYPLPGWRTGQHLVDWQWIMPGGG